MNLDELRSAQAKERRKDSLQHLRDSFYDDVAAYVSDLRAARDRRAEQVANPFSDDDIRRMSDEVETAEEVAEALYERRVGKVVKLASFAAADMSVDADGMTTEERQLFDDLVERISENKSRVLDVLSGETAPPMDETEAIPSAEDPTAAEGTPAGGTDDRVPPAPEPEPPDAVEATRPGDEQDPAAPVDGAESHPPVDDAEPHPPGDDAEPQPPDPDGGALAGAMGNADDEVADALGASPANAPPAETPPADETSEEVGGDGATTDGGPAAVPPGSASSRATDASEPTVSDGTDPTTEPEASTDDRTTVRITRDVGSIFGVDEREYDLANEDVVTLPVENADPLVERDAAERLD